MNTDFSKLNNNELVQKLAVISITSNIDAEQNGKPERDGSERSLRYWSLWDQGFDIIDILAQRRKQMIFSVEGFSFWDSVDQIFKSDYERVYNYDLDYLIRHDDFEDLCRAIRLNHSILFESFRLKPQRFDFKTDAYGVDNFGVIWGFSVDYGETYTELDDETDWEVALHVYSELNGNKPDSEKYGEEAEKLDWLCWSFYDPTYTPLKKRVEQGLA